MFTLFPEALSNFTSVGSETLLISVKSGDRNYIIHSIQGIVDFNNLNDCIKELRNGINGRIILKFN